MLYSQLHGSLRRTYRQPSHLPIMLPIVLGLPIVVAMPTAQANVANSINNYENIATQSYEKVNSTILDSNSQDEGLLDHSSNETVPSNPSDEKINNEIKSAIQSVNQIPSQQKRSLDKLAEFYQPYDALKPEVIQRSLKQSLNTNSAAYDTNAALLSEKSALHNPSSANYPPNDTVDPFLTDGALGLNEALDSTLNVGDVNSPAIDTNTIYANETAPAALPDLYNHPQFNNLKPRCEGVWIAPQSANSNTSSELEGATNVLGLDSGALRALADYGYFDNDSYAELSGNVEVFQDGQRIEAEQLIFDLSRGIAGARGQVVMVDSGASSSNNTTVNDNTSIDSTSGLIVVANNLAYDTNSNAATAKDVAFASTAMQAHGYAAQLNKPDDTHYEMDEVMFSTCPPTNRKWQLDAAQIDIDTETGRGEAYNATFRLGNVPVFYLPYFNFPIDDRRASGLLTPNASFDTESGLKVSVPYYLNLTPNVDATITTDVYSDRNPMLTGELRYLTEKLGQGDLTASYMPSDKEYNGEDRRGIFYQHQWVSEDTPNLSAEAVYNYVSDSEYLNEFDSFGLTDNRLNLPRRAQVNYYNDYINTELKVASYQRLEGENSDGIPITDKDRPYSRLPQVSVDYRLPTVGNNNKNFRGSALDNVIITGVNDTAYFKKSINDGSENERSGFRMYNHLSASYPMVATWGFLTPKVKLQHLYTLYDEESVIDNNIEEDDESQSVFVPEFSIDTGLNFYQPGSPLGAFDESLGGYQLLTPKAKYVYAPYTDQSKVPNFNTRVASRDYDQLFADDWFLGYDRLSDANSLSLGLNYRFVDAMGVTRFDGSIGEQYYFDDIEVTLNEDDKPFEQDSSGLAWNSSLQPYRNVWVDVNGALDSDNELDFLSSQLRYQPTPNSLLNFGVVKRLENEETSQKELSALTASTIFPVSNNWRLMAQGQYDTDASRFIDATLGIDYEDCCYGFSIYGRSYYNDLNVDDDPTQAVMAEIRINGLGDSNSRLGKLLRNKILGFEPVDSTWKK